MIFVYLTIAVFAASAFCFFMKGARPKTFDQMPESMEPPATEYTDQIRIVKTSKDKEPKIRNVINV